MYKKNEFYLLVVFSLILSLFNFILSKYSFPLTEGWWETYAWVSKYKILYTELGLAFPPLFIKLISFLSIFADEIFYLRIIFIFIFILEFILLVKLTGIFGSKYFSLVAAFAASTSMIINNPVWIVKDYHLIVSLLVIILIINIYILTIKYTDKNNLKFECNSIISGISLGLLVLLKQNIAFLTFLSLLIIYIVNLRHYGSRINRPFFILLTSFLSVLSIYSFFEGYGWISAYISNDSKGSPSRILFRVFRDPDSSKILLNSIYIALGLMFITIISRYGFLMTYYENFKKIVSNSGFDYIKNFIGFSISIALIYIALNSKGGNIFSLGLGLCIWEILLVIFLFKKVDPKTNVYIIILFIIYGGTLTAGFNTVSMEIPTAIFLCVAMTKLTCNFKVPKLFIVILLILISLYFFNKEKYNSASYSWWGYSVGTIGDAIYPAEQPYLKGLYLDKTTFEILKATDVAIKKHSTNPTLLAFPAIPIFYKIYNLDPIVSSIVLWFDVFPSSHLKRVKDELMNSPPDIIFWLRPSDVAYEGHALMKESRLPLSEIDKVVLSKIKIGEYRITYLKPILAGVNSGGSKEYLYELSTPTTSEFICNICNRRMLNGLINDGTILDYNFIVNGLNRVKIDFKNNISESEFMERYKQTPVKRSMYIFYILEKTN